MIVKKQTVGYNHLKPHLQTGDIVLMHGNYVSSHFVEFLESSTWSHSAIVVLASDLGIKSDDNVLLFESNIVTTVNDVILGKPKQGPQLVSLHQRMKTNFNSKDDSKFAVRHLYTTRDQIFFDTFNQVISETRNAVFPSTKDEFLGPVRGRYEGIQTPYTYFFCSELVAYTYTKLGLLSNIHPTNSYIPADFSETLSVGLMGRAWLGNEIIIEPKLL